MRRADRAVTGPAAQREILDRCKVLRIALQDEEGLYIVPVTFGYVWEDSLTLYLHSAREGRKVKAMERGCQVAFETDCAYALAPGETACKYSCAYESLVGTGTAFPVEDWQEKAKALAAIMTHQTGGQFAFTEDQTSSVAVFRISVKELSGKRRI